MTTAATRASLAALAELVLAHQTTEVRVSSGEMRLLVESVLGTSARRSGRIWGTTTRWCRWPRRGARGPGRGPPRCADRDGLELLRMLVAEDDSDVWQSPAAQQVRGLGQWNAATRSSARAQRVVRRLGAAGWRTRLPARRPGIAHRVADVQGLRGAHRQAGAQASSSPTSSDVEKPPAFQRKSARRNMTRLARWWMTLFPADARPAHAEGVDSTACSGLCRWCAGATSGAHALRGSQLGQRLTRPGVPGRAVGEPELIDLLWGGTPTSTQVGDLLRVHRLEAPTSKKCRWRRSRAARE